MKKIGQEEFYNYITKSLTQEEISLLYKVNNLKPELSELFYDFISSLMCLIENTYLGDDVIKDNDDIKNHFNWCWKQIIDNFNKEKISFKEIGEHHQYFLTYLTESFYDKTKEFKIRTDKSFIKSLFNFDYNKTKSDIDIFCDLYKLMEKSLSI